MSERAVRDDHPPWPWEDRDDFLGEMASEQSLRGCTHARPRQREQRVGRLKWDMQEPLGHCRVLTAWCLTQPLE